MFKDVEVEIQSPIQNCPPPVISTEPAPVKNITGNPAETPNKQAATDLPTIRPPPPASVPEPHENSAVTRSGRSVKPPSYLKDFVKT